MKWFLKKKKLVVKVDMKKITNQLLSMNNLLIKSQTVVSEDCSKKNWLHRHLY